MALPKCLYNLSAMVYELGVDLSGEVEVLKRYILAGAHPYFLVVAMKYLGLYSGTIDRMEKVITLASNQTKNTPHLHPRMPPSTKEGIFLGPSCLYEVDGSPRLSLGEGIFQGALMDSMFELLQETKKSNDSAAWRFQAREVTNLFFNHPECPLSVAYNIVTHFYMIHDDFDPDKTLHLSRSFLDKELDKFFVGQFQIFGLRKIISKLLHLWDDRTPWGFWTFYTAFMRAVAQNWRATEPLAVTKAVRALQDFASDHKSPMQDPAYKILTFYPSIPDEETVGAHMLAIGAFDMTLDRMKQELPARETYHTLIRWLKILPKSLRHTGIYSLAFVHHSKDKKVVDPRAEGLIKDLMGEDGWRLMIILQDKDLWEKRVEELKDLIPNSKLRKDDDSIKQFAGKVNQLKVDSQNVVLAEHLDHAIASSSEDMDRAADLAEEMTNLLAGQAILIVTHLYDSWMPVPRPADRFMADVFPCIEIAAHPTNDQDRAACRFQFRLDSLPDGENIVSGFLDPEGNMTLDQVPIFPAPQLLALRAALLETHACIRIPRYLNKLPPRGHRGFGLNLTGEVVAREPVIHTLGDLTNRDDPDDGPSMGTRINPKVALRAFLWLTDYMVDPPHRLFRKVVDDIEGSPQVVYRTWRDAKKLLMAKKLTLADVYYQTVRAHSHPCGVVYIKEERRVKVKNMSLVALAKHEQFIADIGIKRGFDFSPVNKHYKFPDLEVDLVVPRTFNQGTYHSLREIWRMIPNPKLKALARERFELGKL